MFLLVFWTILQVSSKEGYNDVSFVTTVVDMC